MSFCRWQRDGLVLCLKVKPGAKQNRWLGLLGEQLKVQITTPPEHGLANLALLKFVAKTFGVPQKSLSLGRGERSGQKEVHIHGDRSDLEEKLARIPQ